jgi:uncharacterized membrane protein YgcG
MRSAERGVALIMVILVLLVLTALGMTAALLMTQEDRISSRQDLQKAALYVAEAGLRRGETTLALVKPVTSAKLDLLLGHDSSSSAVTAAAPDPRPVQPPVWNNRHLGTYLATNPGSSVDFANQEVAQLPGGGTAQFQKIRAYYSLYIRNNPEDVDFYGNPVPLHDSDNRVRLISVGFVTDDQGVAGDGSARVLAVKIVEEEFNFTGWTTSAGGQIGGDQSSTNSGLSGGTGSIGGQIGGGVPGP